MSKRFFGKYFYSHPSPNPVRHNVCWENRLFSGVGTWEASQQPSCRPSLLSRSILGLFMTGKLKAYLAVCVVYQTRNHVKRMNCRQAVGLDQAEMCVTSNPGPLTTAVANEQLRLISEAMIGLPMEQRSVIVLHLRAGMSLSEIAKQLRLSVATAKSRYRYGIAKLRSALEKEVTS